MIQNRLDVDLKEDFLKYREVAEKNMNIIENIFKVNDISSLVISESDIPKKEALIRRCDECVDDFDNIEKKNYEKKSSDGNREDVNLISYEKAIDMFKYYLSYKEKTDILMSDIYNFLIGLVDKSLENLIKDNSRLNIPYRLDKVKGSVMNVGDNTIFQPKIVRYCIGVKDVQIREKVEGKNSLPVIHRVEDYSQIVEAEKERYKQFVCLYSSYVGKVLEDKCNQEIVKRNNIQHKFNIIVSIATIISVITSIGGFIIAYMTYQYK